MNELALFAGAGGGILGGKLLGWRTVCAVEWEPYPASVLCARQNDGFLPPFPIWDDIQTFDGRPWRGIVDVVSGGFPCQDISIAGKGDGLDGERSGMWHHMARVVGEVRPSFVFVENSPMLTSRGGTRVIADLTALGYDTKWTVMGAADVGANHQRDRIWILAHTNSVNRWSKPCNKGCSRKEAWDQSFGRCDEVAYSASVRPQTQGNICQHSKKDGKGQTNKFGSQGEVDYSNCTHGKRNKCAERTFTQHANIDSSGWWQSKPSVGRVADELANRVDFTRGIE